MVSLTLEAEANERARHAAGPRGLSSYVDAIPRGGKRVMRLTTLIHSPFQLRSIVAIIELSPAGCDVRLRIVVWAAPCVGPEFRYSQTTSTGASNVAPSSRTWTIVDSSGGEFPTRSRYLRTTQNDPAGLCPDRAHARPKVLLRRPGYGALVGNECATAQGTHADVGRCVERRTEEPPLGHVPETPHGRRRRLLAGRGPAHSRTAQPRPGGVRVLQDLPGQPPDQPALQDLLRGGEPHVFRRGLHGHHEGPHEDGSQDDPAHEQRLQGGVLHRGHVDREGGDHGGAALLRPRRRDATDRPGVT